MVTKTVLGVLSVWDATNTQHRFEEFNANKENCQPFLVRDEGALEGNIHLASNYIPATFNGLEVGAHVELLT